MATRRPVMNQSKNFELLSLDDDELLSVVGGCGAPPCQPPPCQPRPCQPPPCGVVLDIGVCITVG
jgi:hypothetical protein